MLGAGGVAGLDSPGRGGGLSAFTPLSGDPSARPLTTSESALPPIVVIVGPTASGKSDLATRLALALGGEVLNADSRQVYRRLNIGTAKPAVAERGGIAHHLFDLVEPEDGGRITSGEAPSLGNRTE